MPNLLWFQWERDVDGYRIEEIEPEGDARVEGKTPHLVPIGRGAVRYRPLDEHPGMFKEFANCEWTAEGAKKFTDKFGLLTSTDTLTLMSIDHWCYQSTAMEAAVSFWADLKGEGNLSRLINLFNELELAPIRVKFDRAWDDIHPALYIVPNNLLAAMWLQFAQAVSSNTEFRKCLHCPAWFTYGPGTGRRKTAFYCSARCRRAAHRSREKRK